MRSFLVSVLVLILVHQSLAFQMDDDVGQGFQKGDSSSSSESEGSASASSESNSIEKPRQNSHETINRVSPKLQQQKQKLSLLKEKHTNLLGTHHTLLHKLTKNKTAVHEETIDNTHDLLSGVHEKQKIEFIKSQINTGNTGNKPAKDLFKIQKNPKKIKSSIWDAVFPKDVAPEGSPKIDKSDEVHAKTPKVPKFSSDSNEKSKSESRESGELKTGGPGPARNKGWGSAEKDAKIGGPGSTEHKNGVGSHEISELPKTGGPGHDEHENGDGSHEISELPKTGGPKSKIWGSDESTDVVEHVPVDKSAEPEENSASKSDSKSASEEEEVQKRSRKRIPVVTSSDESPEETEEIPKSVADPSSEESDESEPKKIKPKLKAEPPSVESEEFEPKDETPEVVQPLSDESDESDSTETDDFDMDITSKILERKTSRRRPHSPHFKKQKLHPESTDPFDTIYPKDTGKIVPSVKLLYSVNDTSPEDNSLEEWYNTLNRKKGLPTSAPEPRRRHDDWAAPPTTPAPPTTEEPVETSTKPFEWSMEADSAELHEGETTPRELDSLEGPANPIEPNRLMESAEGVTDITEPPRVRPTTPRELDSMEGPANPIEPNRFIESAEGITDITEPPRAQQTSPAPDEEAPLIMPEEPEGEGASLIMPEESTTEEAPLVMPEEPEPTAATAAPSRKPMKNIWLRFKERETEPPSTTGASTTPQQSESTTGGGEDPDKRSRHRNDDESTTTEATTPQPTTEATTLAPTTEAEVETTPATPPPIEDDGSLGKVPEDGSCDRHALTPTGDEDEEDERDPNAMAKGYEGVTKSTNTVEEESEALDNNEINFKPGTKGAKTQIPKFEDVLPKFKMYKTKLTKLITRMVPQCPEIHGLRLLRLWMRMFRHAFPNFVAMTLESMKYSEDLKLQLGACFERLVTSDFGYNKKKSKSKSAPAKNDEGEGAPKFKRSSVDVGLLGSSFLSEVADPILNYFTNMPQLVQSAVSDVRR